MFLLFGHFFRKLKSSLIIHLFLQIDPHTIPTLKKLEALSLPAVNVLDLDFANLTSEELPNLKRVKLTTTIRTPFVERSLPNYLFMVMPSRTMVIEDLEIGQLVGYLARSVFPNLPWNTWPFKFLEYWMNPQILMAGKDFSEICTNPR